VDKRNQLYWMNLDFIQPLSNTVSGPVAAFPAVPMQNNVYPKLKLTPLLWHQHLGHLGLDSTCNLLLKDCTTGLNYNGPFTFGNCVACIIGKSSQLPYLNKALCADNVGDLLHMDVCSPFAKMSFRNKTQFVIILDDRSNWGFYKSMAKRTEILEFVQHIESFLFRLTNCRVKILHFDGILEFGKGPLGDWLCSQGIIL